MSAIVVCPLSKLAETVAAHRASHVLSLVNAGTVYARPPVIPAANHLHVAIHDIVAAADGMTLADAAHVGQMLDFVARWDRAAPIVVHCYAGVSRSTAAAYAATCAARPDLDEAEVARRLRAGSPEATPNAHIVALADAMLGREGRMVAAIAAIGRGVDCFEGSVFALRLDD